MSMLAEPRMKRRGAILNPRGTLWSIDENKFGQKLLEKMGWAKGKGLGINKQGITEPIKIRQNPASKGIGYKGNAEAWTKHNEAYEDVLANLSNVDNPEGENVSGNVSSDQMETKITSLEAKSKSSRSRVHYKKFTRGKDLSTCSEEDLACILGSKKKHTKIKQEEENQDNKFKDDIELNQSFGLTTIYGGSLKDYFTHKMEELKRKREEGLLGSGSGSTSVSATPLPDLDFEPAKTEFSFNTSFEASPTEEQKETEERSLSVERKKERKINKEAVAANGIQEKKRKKDKVKTVQLEEINEHEIFMKEILKKRSEKNKEKIENEKVNDEHIEYLKKKKSKNTFENYTSDEQDGRKKMKERKRGLVYEEENVNEGTENTKTKRKKHKAEIGVGYAEGERENALEDDSEDKIEYKKKARKTKYEEPDIAQAENDPDRNKAQTKKGKKKKSEEEETPQEEKEQELKIKKKKKKVGSAEDEAIESLKQKATDGKDQRESDMNQSYISATSAAEGKKKKNRKKDISDERSDNPLKKIKKLASDLGSMMDLLRGTKAITEATGPNTDTKIDKTNDSCDESVHREVDKPKKKLSSKKSFKELCTELGDKVKLKIKKNSKKKLLIVETDEVMDGNEPPRHLMTLRAHGRTTYSFPMILQASQVNYDTRKLFPGSNLDEIKGYEP